MRWILSVLALAAILLGGLWFFQGTGLIVLDPIACVGDCQPLEGPSVLWSSAGLVLIFAGGAVLRFAWRRR